ncbi:MAG: STAS/SEC14 domain-containing protein [Candidatus Omnitrophota bacterium]|nr:STAS/SEC14 domain-containing protein [Candidatus Omnitrophota bacterium]
MIEILAESHDNVLGIKGSGKITDQDYKEVIIPKIDSILSKYGRGKFLYYLSEEFEGFELGAMWDDLKYAGSYSDKFDKIALVGGPRWVEWTTKVFGHFVKAEMKTFAEDQLDDAWQWIES